MVEGGLGVVVDDVVDVVVLLGVDDIVVVEVGDGRRNKVGLGDFVGCLEVELLELGFVEFDFFVGVGVGGVVEF